MILAWSTVDGLDPAHFAWLAVWTLIGGTLAAGTANAINCYLDRDIDEIMVRTRRRPLPAHQVAPVDGLLFGLVLTVISFGILAVTTNLVAAFLTLLAIGFYVVVYTMLLKRSTPQNIVLGGAPGRCRRSSAGRRSRVTSRCPRCCCSPSSSTGRRPTSGRCPCASGATTPRPACR